MSRDGRDRRRAESEGGIPDGLLVGVLAFLLGMTFLIWSATGLAGWFAHGAWPNAVTFARTPLALRHLIGHPHDVAGAWPDSPPDQLSGYGLFWGLFIGQLMVLVVMAVFVMGTWARWRAVRARRKAGAYARPVPAPVPTPAPVPEPTPTQLEVPVQRPAPEPTELLPAEAEPHQPASATLAVDSKRLGGWERSRTAAALILGPAETRHPTATQAVRDADGPALVVTSNPAIWSETKDARAKLGPVLLYDPSHLCDTPARLHWSPATGCEDKATAASRAAALLGPVRPTAKVDQAMADVAETLLRSYLHAAAVEGKAFRHVHRWAQGAQVQDAVRALRTNPKAASGAAGELEAALTSHPERRDIAQELTARALSALFTVNVRESCTPNRSDALTLDSFVNEGGTLYVVGEPIEDPKANPGAMPLLTALVSSVVERGRRMAERSSSGRLDPPLTLVLDDIAAVAPLPQLPGLLATGADQGLPTLALLRSQEQARARWPQHELPV
ncbi:MULTISPECIES: type IV secretory system conjugative DNA transfer family protein [unclassified Streptomyces]|uniref:type IV secretory system conjugative DNA transfer family protein n=1 Tax=unclassified Streptomyces TaxID=2593676 RepID=UPI002252F1BD|nr:MULTISPECIES: type IV secretory system conjugative DNA transfer family protein [unclassified Streptomyces]MCX4408834.1 type IV secretory system conjugative DNA transfer family protein [Streptomyces sp. NBC_01764]MCX5185625.1 type IV secretory system conjugative DNA transfer family protein [Streptomyces sp. NBC_00268]